MKRFITAVFTVLIAIPINALASIKVDPAAQRAGGLVVQSLDATRLAPDRTGYGVVLDPGPLISLRSNIIAAQANGKLSAQSLDRAKKLYGAGHNIAMAALEAAQAHDARARAAEMSLVSHANVDWGAALGAALIRGGSPLVALKDGKISLIDVVVTGVPIAPPPTAQGETAEGTRIELRFIGQATRLPSGLIGQGLYYAGPPSISVGMPISVKLASGPPQAGVIVPAAAIIYQHGHRYVFRKSGQDSFDMVAITAMTRMDETNGPTRYFVAGGLQPGQQIVVKGVGVLLSAAAKH